MICPVCHTDYQLQHNNWKFEGHSENEEGIYIVLSNVYTPEILEEILEHALQNELTEISVDAYSAEFVTCEGCQILNIRLAKERDKLLDLPRYQKLLYYGCF